MDRFLKVVGFLLLVNITLAEPIPFKDCGSTATDITLNVANCSKVPCTFVKNTNASLTIEFTSKAVSKTLKNLVYGIIAGVKVPFPIPQEDACKYGLPCPLQPNIHVKEELDLAVLPEYPSISLFAQIQINDENSQPVVCILLPVKIQ